MLPVYNRGLWRIAMLVVALSLTAVSTGVSAREFRVADTQSEDHPTVQAFYSSQLCDNFEPDGFVEPTIYDSGTRPQDGAIRCLA